jgi:hypothetical protein
MRRILVFITIPLFILMWQVFFFYPCRAQTTHEPAPITVEATDQYSIEPQIISPEQGEVLSGSVPVVVDTTAPHFESVELTFRYEDDSTETWFLIHQGVRPVTGTLLVLWDTTTITDGNYSLQMVVKFDQGEQISVLVPDLHVRNNSPAKTDAPTQNPAILIHLPSTPTTTPTLTQAPAESSSSFPATPVPPMKNPAEIQPVEVLKSVGRGALFVFFIFTFGFIFSFILAAVRNKHSL